MRTARCTSPRRAPRGGQGYGQRPVLGTLTGLLFMFPLAPLAGLAGGIMGTALGAAWHLGIKDDFRQRVQDLVQPGTSALMVIVRKTTPDKFTEALRPYGGTVLKTSLPRDAELPVALANCPVPPVTCKLSCCVPLNKQLCRLIEEPGRHVRGKGSPAGSRTTRRPGAREKT